MIFVFHVARLAKPHEVAAGVGLVGALEKPKRTNVVNRQAFANVFSAFVAAAVLIRNNLSPRFQPSTSAIGSRSTNPIGSKFAFRFRSASAGCSAIFGKPVLSDKPRFLTELIAAMLADPSNAFLPTRVGRASHLFWRESVCGPFTSPELIPEQVSLGRSVKESFSLPTAAARGRAKSRLFFPVRFDAESSATAFAMLFNHKPNIARPAHMGNGSSLIACKRVEEAARQPDLFLEPAAKPEQTGMEFE